MKTIFFNYENCEVRCPICNEINFYADDLDDSGVETPCKHNLFRSNNLGFTYISKRLIELLDLPENTDEETIWEDYNFKYNSAYLEDAFDAYSFSEIVENLPFKDYILLKGEIPDILIYEIYYGFLDTMED
jgi:hypothetical protein